MTARRGNRHSEYNASESDPVHLYQIWLLPVREGLEPSYEQKAFPEAGRRDRLQLVASPDGEDGALTIRQDARLYLASLDAARRSLGGEAGASFLGPGPARLDFGERKSLGRR